MTIESLPVTSDCIAQIEERYKVIQTRVLAFIAEYFQGLGL